MVIKPLSPIIYECRITAPPQQEIPKNTTVVAVVIDNHEIRQQRFYPDNTYGSSSPRRDYGNSAPVAKVVSFSKRVTVKQILHLNDMGETMRNRYWLSPDEISNIKNHCRFTLRRMMLGDDIVDKESSEFCSRGLESRTRDAQKDKIRRRDAVRRAVLMQEQIQTEEGIFDPDFLAAVSATKSKQCRERAHKLALKDAEEARNYLQQAAGGL